MPRPDNQEKAVTCQSLYKCFQLRLPFWLKHFIGKTINQIDFRVPPARRGNLKEGGNCRLCPRDWYYSSPISRAGSPFVLSCSLSWGAVCVR